MKEDWRYDSVFAQASFQFGGHMDEYLIRHARHLGLIYHQTRFGRGGHLFRRYEEGALVEERRLPSAKAIPLYYWRLWWSWHRELARFTRGKGRVMALFSFPLLAAGMMFRRNVRHVFWQWDYFPGGGITERMFNAVARHYAHRCEYCAVSTAIAKAVGRPDAKVMRLGMVPPTRFGDPKSNRILMVGQLRKGQGVEDVLDFLAAHGEYSLSLMGAAANGFEKEIAERVAAAKMSDRVYFPNRFVSDAELREEAAKCFVSLALYDTSPGNLTHYADPGKVKSSIEMGLPVVMTRISETVSYVERFHAGEVIDSLLALPAALAKIRVDSVSYFSGCQTFAECFACNRYYEL